MKSGFSCLGMGLGFFLGAAPLSLAANFLQSSGTLKHSLNELIPEAKQSYYSARIFEPLRNWPPASVQDPLESASPVWLQPIKTPGKPNYIGLSKRLRVHAPLAKVVALIDDFENYKNLFSDVNDAHVVSVDGNKVTTAWERPSPVFFVSNTRYQQVYLVDKSSPERAIYRYQLIQGNHVNYSDGIIVLERSLGEKNPLGVAEEVTIITGYDFFDADWGLLRTLAESKIWKASLEGSLRGDLALKAKAEHPEWSKKQIRAEVDQTVNKFPINLDHLKPRDQLE